MITALAGVGGLPTNLARLRLDVVDMTPDEMPMVMEGVGRRTARLGSPPPVPATLIGVTALDVPEHLVEIEATTMLD